MDYVLDTVGLIRHLAGGKRLGKTARVVLDEADKGVHHIIVSAISLMEILYLSERGRITASLKEAIELISKSTNYSLSRCEKSIKPSEQSFRPLSVALTLCSSAISGST